MKRAQLGPRERRNFKVLRSNSRLVPRTGGRRPGAVTKRQVGPASRAAFRAVSAGYWRGGRAGQWSLCNLNWLSQCAGFIQNRTKLTWWLHLTSTETLRWVIRTMTALFTPHSGAALWTSGPKLIPLIYCRISTMYYFQGSTTQFSSKLIPNNTQCCLYLQSPSVTHDRNDVPCWDTSIHSQMCISSKTYRFTQTLTIDLKTRATQRLTIVTTHELAVCSTTSSFIHCKIYISSKIYNQLNSTQVIATQKFINYSHTCSFIYSKAYAN